MQQFSSLLQKEVTRRQFIISACALLLTIVGIHRIVELFSPKEKNGFGSGPYGR